MDLLSFTTTPTVTGTATPSGLGGGGFAIQLEGPAAQGGAVRGRATGDRLFSWDPGTQARSLVASWSQARGFVFLPSLANPLGQGVGVYRDSSPLTEPIHCYVLVSFVGELPNPGARALSNLLCVIPESGIGNRPRDFTVQLNQSSDARLSWSGPGGQTGYRLVVHPLNSPFSAPTFVGPGETTKTMPTGGEPTCFQLFAVDGAQIMGVTDGLCVFPGIASAGIGAASAPPRSVVSLHRVARSPRNPGRPGPVRATHSADKA